MDDLRRRREFTKPEPDLIHAALDKATPMGTPC